MFRTILLVGISATALVATGAGAVSFIYTGVVQDYTIAYAGVYHVQASGAQGGGTFQNSTSYDPNKGNGGASVSANMTFSAPAKVHVVVGGQGGAGGNLNSGAGGGGGTFVVTDAYAPLVVAGGGGGAGTGTSYSDGNYSSYLNYGTNASTTGNGSTAYDSGAGGTNGHSGDNQTCCEGSGGGGGGVYGGGNSYQQAAGGAQGGGAPGFGGGSAGSPNTRGVGGKGGFGGGGGGGGGGNYVFDGGGGGGGGYSGGGGGAGAFGEGGGGGGSFTAIGATNVSATVSGTGGDGSASIDAVRLFANAQTSAAKLDFGVARNNYPLVQTVNITNNIVDPSLIYLQDSLKISQTSTGPASLVLSLTSLFPGQSSGLQYRLPTTTSGQVSGTTTVSFLSLLNNTVDKNSVALQSAVISYIGKVYQTAIATVGNTSIDFGATRVGTYVDRTINITNSATGRLVDTLTTSVTPPAGMLGLAPDKLTSGRSGSVDLTIGVTAGIFNGTTVLRFASTDADLAPQSLGVKIVTYTGKVYAAAVATLATASVDFGVVRGNSIATRQIALTNTATGALTDVLVTTLSSASPGVTVALPSALSAGRSSSIGFTLATGTPGVVSGSTTLGFASHDGDLADLALHGQTVSVTGTVTDLARALIVAKGDGLLTFSNGHYVLNLGDIAANSGLHSTLVSALNGVKASAFSEVLTAYYSGLSSDGFSLALHNPFNAAQAGDPVQMYGELDKIAGGMQTDLGLLGFDPAGLCSVCIRKRSTSKASANSAF